MRCAQYTRTKREDKSTIVTTKTDQSDIFAPLAKKTRLAVMTRQTRSHTTRSAAAASHGNTVPAPKPVKSETVPYRTSGGRHLQPPTGNNAKLKHKCPFDGCPWRFATPYKLRRHIKSHTKETPYECKECGRGFSVRYNLLMHIQTIHSAPQNYRCPIGGCKEAFHTQPRLNGHLRRVHKKDWKQLQVEQQAAATVSKSRSSSSEIDSTAGSPCSTDSSLSNDKDQHTSATPAPKKWFSCMECQRKFSSQARLSAHMRIHRGNHTYKCPSEGCSKTFPTQDKLSKHSEGHKTSTRRFHCNQCSRSFVRQSHLKNHCKIHSRSTSSISSLDTNVTSSQSDDSANPQGTYLGRMIENNDLLGSLELPDLKVEDVESVISEHTDWSGEQIESFLKSLDLGVIDNGGLGYESDSGYSTYDVSPLGSSVSSAHYHSALSPAITPVTPTPLLSPSPFYPPYQDDFNNAACSFSFPTPRPLSASSSTEGHFLFNSDLTMLPATPTDNLSEYSFPPTPYQTEFVPSPHYQYQPIPHLLMAPPTNMASQDAHPKLLQVGQESICAPPTSNPMEDNKHTVLVVPNTYSMDTPKPTSPPQPITTTPSVAVKEERKSPSPVSTKVVSSIPSSTHNPIKSTFSSSAKDGQMDTKAMSQLKHSFALPKATTVAKSNEPISLCSEGGRMVYAQILPGSTKLNQYDISKIMGKTTMTKGKGKGFKHSRQRSSSLSMKSGRKPRSQSQWPKSISSGNLIAFRNFILNKLKKTNKEFDPSFMSMAAGQPGMAWMTAINEGALVDAEGHDDTAIIKICNNFNPDALLASDGSTDALPSPPVIMRTSSLVEDSVHTPLTDGTLSLESCLKLSCDGGMDAADDQLLGYGRDLEEYTEYLSLNPLSQNLSEQEITASLDSIFKTDADPLLGSS